MMTIGTWDKLLRYSTPFFQLAEGFCSLLVIQAAGQITRWLVNRRSDTWMVCSFFHFLYEYVTDSIDRFAHLIRLHHIHLHLFSLADYDLPRNRERRCHTYWSYDHLCGVLMRLGDRKWPREPSRELSTICLCGLMHLPNFHRLPTNIGTSTTPSTTGVSTISSDNYGIIFDFGICTVNAAVGGAFGIHLPICGFPDHHPFRHNFPRLSDLRVLRGHTNYPCSPRVRSSGFVTRAKFRGQ